MTIYNRVEKLPYLPSQLFDLVSNIEAYPCFIPWCQGVNIIERDNNILLANLMIRYHGINGRYTSKVHLDRENQVISVELAQGPFEYLYQAWKFTKIDQNTTIVEFDIDFKLRSFLLNTIVALAFPQVCRKVMNAFKVRANQLYSKK